MLYSTALPTVNGQPASSAQVFSFPATLNLPLEFAGAAPPGILDALDLSTSRVTVGLLGQTPTNLSLTATDDLHYQITAPFQLTAAGTYSVTLNGRTQSGQVVSAATSFPLAVTPVGLTVDPPVQDGAAVTVAVRWPASPVVTNQVTSCGTSPAQTFTGAAGTCRYTKAGTYVISGTFTDPKGIPNVSTAASSVTIPIRPIHFQTLGPVVDDQSTSALTVYSTPIPIEFPLSFTAAPNVGILDTLDLSRSNLQVAREGLPLPQLPVTGQSDLEYRAATTLTAPGTYTFNLVARTKSGQVHTASTQFVLTVNSVTLAVDPMSQQDETVVVPVRWPERPVFTDYQVDCGIAGQQFTGPTGQCIYDRPGTFTITGHFTDLRHTTNVPTAPALQVVPAVLPASTPITPTINGEPAADVRVYNFPAPVDLPVSFTRPADIGILDELDLAASRVDVVKNGGAPNRITLTRTDGLHYATTTNLTESGSYSFTLQGVTKTGQSVTASGSLTLTLTPVNLSTAPLVQDGFAVTAAVRWPAEPVVTGMRVNCGTPIDQVFAGTTGTCRFTEPGTYTVLGTFTDPAGVPGIRTAPLAIEVPALALTTPALVASINGQPLGAQTIYALPQTVAFALTFTPSVGVGVVDALNLSPSRMAVSKDGAALSRPGLTASDPVTYASSVTIGVPGAYVFALDGRSKGGTPIAASVAATIAVVPVPLQAGTLTQSGKNVSMDVAWPAEISLVDRVVNCGTQVTQTFAGPTGQCLYAKAGTYTVSGTFTDPTNGQTVQAAPATVVIPAVPNAAGVISLKLNGMPATETAVSTTLPAVLDVLVTLTPPAQGGILDPVFAPTTSFTMNRAALAPLPISLSLNAEGTLLTGQLLLSVPGEYRADFTAKTQGNATLTSTTTTVLSGTAITLQLGTLSQTGPRHIEVPVSFPDAVAGSKYLIDCGTTRSQVLSGKAVACEYSAPGTFKAVGTFIPDGSAARVPTAETPVVVPAIPPPYYKLSVDFPSAGTLTVEGTEERPRYRLAPKTYPVDLKVGVEPIPPTDAGVGIVSPFDPNAGKLQLTMVSTIDGQPVPTSATVSIPLHDDPVTGTFGVRSTFRGFDLGAGAPKISGRFRLEFQGKLLDGTAVTQGADVTIDEPELQAMVIPYGVEGPYAPATYRYRLSATPSTVKRERLTLSWTVRREGETEILREAKSATAFNHTFTEPGTYRISLVLVGSVSGTYTWSEVVTVPVPENNPDAPVIRFSSGGAQRPPVQYALRTSYPPLEAGDRYVATEWSLDGQVLTRPANRPMIQTPGAHAFGLTLRSKHGVEKTATQAIEVRPNMSPRGTIDCSKSVPKATGATLRCSGTGLDPDGRIANRRWVVPELNIDTRTGWSLKATVPNPPDVVTVHLYVTDNSGQTEDLGPVSVQLRPAP